MTTNADPKPGNQQATLVRGLGHRTPLHHDDFPFVVFWSEKSGCTGIVKYFFHRLGLLEEAMSHSGWVHDYENAVFKASPDYNARLIEALMGGKPAVKFVRDPVARAYSSYLEVCRPFLANPTTPAQKAHWANGVRRSILAHFGAGTAIEYAFSFADFVAWMEENDVHALNSHIAPQYVPGLEDAFPVRPIQIEDLTSALTALEDEFGLDHLPPEDAEKLFSSGHHHVKHEGPAIDVKKAIHLAVPVHRRGNFPYLSVDRHTIQGTTVYATLRRIFAEDFERYGYQSA